MICQHLPYKYTKRRRTYLLLHFPGAKFLCWCNNCGLQRPFPYHINKVIVVVVVDTQRTNVRHIWSGRHLAQFLRIFRETKVELGKKKLYHVYQLLVGYLSAKYEGSHFLDYVPPLTWSRKKGALKWFWRLSRCRNVFFIAWTLRANDCLAEQILFSPTLIFSAVDDVGMQIEY